MQKLLEGREKVSTFAPAIERDGGQSGSEKMFRMRPVRLGSPSETRRRSRKKKKKLPKKFGGKDKKALPLRHVFERKKSSLNKIYIDN